jgi:acetoin utilization deacetylase AcuC-like enzyme
VAVAGDPLATMTCKASDFGHATRLVTHTFGFPPCRVALGLEGGYDLDEAEGMPAALVHTCAALIERGPTYCQ